MFSSNLQSDAFVTAFDRLTVLPGPQPTICFKKEELAVFLAWAELRKKDWKSTAHWNPLAEVTGLLGELAVLKVFGFTAQQAMEDFKTGLRGDAGIDLRWAGHTFDVKTTRGKSLRFKFSKTNRCRNNASGFIFCSTQDVGTALWVTLLGWVWRAALKPYLRDDGMRFFCRYPSLARDRIVQPIKGLKNSSDLKGGDAIVQV